MKELLTRSEAFEMFMKGEKIRSINWIGVNHIRADFSLNGEDDYVLMVDDGDGESVDNTSSMVLSCFISHSKVYEVVE